MDDFTITPPVADISADNSESATLREPGRATTVLAFATTGGFFALLGLLAYHQTPESSRDLMNIMLGTLASGWTAVISYYFGSSLGHDQVTRALTKPARQPSD